MTPAVHRPQAAPVDALLEAALEVLEVLEVLLEDVEEPDPFAAGVFAALPSEEDPLEDPEEAGSLAVLLLRLSVR